MSELAYSGYTLPAAPSQVMEWLKDIERRVREREDGLADALRFRPRMEHVLHAGMYARTCRLDAGMMIVSVLIKIPTVLTVHGAAWVFAGERWHKVEGYQCMPAAAGRKQIYVTAAPTEITMVFATTARTVEEAEAEFTDEAEELLSRRQDNGDVVVVTGA